MFNWYYLSFPPQVLRVPVVGLELGGLMYVSPPLSSPTPGVFYKYFYNHAYRLRLEKLLYLALSRSSNGCFKARGDL